MSRMVSHSPVNRRMIKPRGSLSRYVAGKYHLKLWFVTAPRKYVVLPPATREKTIATPSRYWASGAKKECEVSATSTFRIGAALGSGKEVWISSICLSTGKL